jgi:Rod binding domain-containing protein
MPVSDVPSGNSILLESLKGRKDAEAVKAVAKEMEALFAYELIKAMRKTTGQSLKGGLGGDIYTSLFDMELAKLCAEKGLGIKEMLMRSLDRGKYMQESGGDAQKGAEKP